MSQSELTSALSEQLAYYCARATEYDQWWLRLGRYDRGPELNVRWAAEAAQVSAALAQFHPQGRILELACGTGIWTEQLLPFADTLTAVDGSREMLAVNAAKLHSPNVRYVQADLFAWEPAEQFDTLFFGFWLSHVPVDRFDAFWALVRRCLAPGGRVFFVDSRHETTSTAIDHQLAPSETCVQHRRLNDGRAYQVYKVFYDPGTLTARLRALGWDFEMRETSTYFLYGAGRLLA